MLPKHETTITLDVLGNETQHRYRGDFSVKTLLTNRETLETALQVDRMGGSSPTLETGYALFIRAIAELDTRIVDSPKWWKDSMGGRELNDSNVVSELYGKVLEAAAEYKKKLKEEAEKVEAATKEVEKRKAAKKSDKAEEA